MKQKWLRQEVPGGCCLSQLSKVVVVGAVVAQYYSHLYIITTRWNENKILFIETSADKQKGFKLYKTRLDLGHTIHNKRNHIFWIKVNNKDKNIIVGSIPASNVLVILRAIAGLMIALLKPRGSPYLTLGGVPSYRWSKVYHILSIIANGYFSMFYNNSIWRLISIGRGEKEEWHVVSTEI